MIKKKIRGLLAAALFLVVAAGVTAQCELHLHADYSPGDVYGTCPNCGLNVTILDIIERPTCTTAGSAFVACVNYDYDATVTLPAYGHSYTSVVTNGATCTASGTRVNTCSRCGDSYTETIAALGHNYSSSVTKAETCTESGVRTYSCSRCGSSYTETVAALGHNYNSSMTKAATCTEPGATTYFCSRCGDSYSEVLPAIGHNYISAVTKEATCEEEGVKTFTCSNCGDEYTEGIAALGHKYKYTVTEATCVKDGSRIGKCTVCGAETEPEILSAPGHRWDTVVLKEADCENDGLQKMTCKACGEEQEQVIEKLGHQFPEEWTLEKEATYNEEGLESKTCAVCGARIEQKIPKKSVLTFVLIGVGVLAVASGIYVLVRRSRRFPGIGAPTGEADNAGFKPAFETKGIVITEENKDLIEFLKKQKYLQVKTCKYDALDSCVEENEPDLIICYVNDTERLEEVLAKKKEETFAEPGLAFTGGKAFLEEQSKRLKALKKSDTIIDYVPTDCNDYVALVKLVLPVLKPDLSSDEALENIGNIADALGIPVISTVISTYVAGRDIKATLESEELGTVETATIIGDMASILGFDGVESVAGLVTDVDSISTALDEESGAYEHSEGASAAGDIIDVVTEMMKK